LAEEVRTFFRRCPSCGRRFEIRLVNKKLISSEQLDSKVEQYTPTSVFAPVIVESNVPLVVEVDDFGYTYRCKHCGHQWSEDRFKTQNEQIDQNITD
jgi:DNA-directed RNA polymerase subunit RPC12/RpoP